MVKNKKGGSSHKKMARKNVAPKGGYKSRKLRKVVEEGEIYARITAISGGGHAVILCSDGKVRTLVIRGKFRGRNKRDNTIRLNTLVIAGLRSVSMGEVVSGKNKKEKADLIYVYNENDFDELKEIPAVMNIISDEKRGQINTDKNSGFVFENDEEEDEEEEEKVIEKNKNKENFKIGDVEISFDDI